MKLWIDDLRPAPEGYRHVYTVEEAIYEIMRYEREQDWAMREYILGHKNYEQTAEYYNTFTITEISCDNDLGEGNAEGYKLLDWLEITGRNKYPIHIHTDNAVARMRMKATIQKNGWKEVF